MRKALWLGFAALAFTSLTGAVAQSGGPSGPGAVRGDPAASSASESSAPPTTGAAKQSPSGSGSSSSGGRDDNGDQGRDTMPGSDRRGRSDPQNGRSGR